jgi:hypothetical protein
MGIDIVYNKLLKQISLGHSNQKVPTIDCLQYIMIVVSLKMKLFNMKEQNYFILTADIIGSRKKDQNKLMEDFKEITKSITKEHKEWFLSPVAITLGE